MTKYQQKFLMETLYAVNQCIAEGRRFVGIKTVKRVLGIKRGNRSATNFLWRSLKELENRGVLKYHHKNSVIVYKILVKKRVFI